MVSRDGMSIRFPLESVPIQGRISAGVKGIALEKGDEVFWSGQLDSREELILFSDRGWGKRMPAGAFESQNRGGKGVRCFFFNKNGSNGRSLAGAVRTLEGGEETLMVFQARSPYTSLAKEEVLLQNRQGKGMPYVMAILDDVITSVSAVEKPSET